MSQIKDLLHKEKEDKNSELIDELQALYYRFVYLRSNEEQEINDNVLIKRHVRKW